MDTLSLIDVSAEDDLFLDLASPPALPEPSDHDPPRSGFRVGDDLVPAGGSPAAADPRGATGDEAAPELAESPKQRKAKTGVNLRKSLAWDSAFFTSEGVLDTEELAIVNSTFRKTQGSRLPGITEESRRSGESTASTLDSESWAVESIETELFDSVRASIQRSLGKPNKATAGTSAGSKPPMAAANAPRAAGRKGIDQMPQVKRRAPVSTSQGVGAKQRLQATSNKPIATRTTLTEDKEAKPSSRPPRALPRVATMRSSTNTTIASGISDKRSSTGGLGNNRQAVGKSANTSAAARPGGVMKSSSVPKTAGLTSETTKPDTKNKSATLSCTKRKAQRIPIVSSSKSDCSKTNPKRPSGNKIPALNRASPTISPSSSIDSMSSVISGVSTVSTIGKMSHTSESSPSLRKSNDQPLATKLMPPDVTEGQSSVTATAGTTDKGKGSRPLALRRPAIPKKGFFDAEKSTDQVQSTKIQQLLSVTPKSKLSSTQVTFAAACSFGQQELEFTEPPEESGASKSKAVMSLSVKGAQMDALPFKIAEADVCANHTGPIMAQPELGKSVVQTDAQVQLLATLSSQQSSMQPLVLTASCDERISSTSEAVIEVEPSPVVQLETVAFTSKVAQPEVYSPETHPIVAEHEAEKSIDQNIGEQVQGQPMVLAASRDEIISSTSEAVIEVKPSPVVQLETIASTSNVAQPEPCLQTTHPIVAEHEVENSIDQNIGEQVVEQPMKIQLEESSALKNKAENVVPLNLAKAGAEQLDVEQTEVVKVAENEAFVHQSSPLVATREELKENIQASDDASSVSVEMIQKFAASTLDQQELRPTEPPHQESSALKSKVEKVVPLKVAEAGEHFVADKTEVVKIAENKASMHQTTEESKENIPALHKNIQANDDANSISVEMLIQKMSSVSIGQTPDMTS